MTSATFTSAWYAQQQAKRAPKIETAVSALNSVTLADARFVLSGSKDFAKLNKTERAYHEALKSRADVLWVGVQNITLKLADDCRITPDFATVNHEGHMTLIDVKGFQREDAYIKMKVAARTFPMFRFVIVKRSGGGWDERMVQP